MSLTVEDTETFAAAYLAMLAERQVVTEGFAILHSEVQDGNITKTEAFDTFSRFLMPVGMRALHAATEIPQIGELTDKVRDELHEEYNAVFNFLQDVTGVSDLTDEVQEEGDK